MVKLERIAEAALSGDALGVRSLVQDWIAESPNLHEVTKPETDDVKVLAVAASLLELLAERAGSKPPLWTSLIAPLIEPLFLVSAAKTMPRMRALCEQATPAPLRKRGIFAPPNYLVFV